VLFRNLIKHRVTERAATSLHNILCRPLAYSEFVEGEKAWDIVRSHWAGWRSWNIF